MELSFGARLRAQREQQQVSLTAISAATKIKLGLLEGLEADDVSRWPNGLFRRSYVRDYARAIGLDPEATVREFLERYPDPMLTPEMGADDVSAEPEPRFRRFIPSLLHRARRADRVEQSISMSAAHLVTAPAAPDPSLDHLQGVGEIAEEVSIAVPLPDGVAASTAEDPCQPTEGDARPAAEDISLSAVAVLCTQLARAVDSADLGPVLTEAARLLDATGVIIWAWDSQRRVLTPSLARGYADTTIDRLPAVSADASNAIAAAFRSAEPYTVAGGEDETGALVVPMTAPQGCIGVVALELRNGRERHDSVRSAAQILAAQLATLLDFSPVAHAATA
jgi:hypothetical protein